MSFKKVIYVMSLLMVGLAMGQAYRLARSVWTLTHANHAPMVRQNGYPIVRKSIELAKTQTVLISSEGFEGTYRGSGVIIDSMTVLTCYHMVKSYQDDIWVFVYPGKRVLKAHPIEGNENHDLALLRLEEPVKLARYAVFNTTTTLGQPITVIGNMQGAMRWFVSYGVVSAYDRGFIITDALIHGGNSGGPWINDKGEIVAITDWGLETGDGKELGINGGIAAGDIVKWVYAVQHPVNLFDLLFGVEHSSAPTKSK